MARTYNSPVHGHGHLGYPRRIVIHTAEGALHALDLPPFFRRAGVDAHMAIDRQGIAVHMVPDSQKAYHVANYNGNSLGIELCAFASYNAKQWIVGFHRGLIRAAAACSNWAGHYRIPLQRSRNHGVCGHLDLGQAGGGHWDPGYHFPWRYFLYLARLHFYRKRGWTNPRHNRRRARKAAAYKRYCLAVQRYHNHGRKLGTV